MRKESLNTDNLIKNVIALLENARGHVVRSINKAMVLTYFEIGRLIIEEEQKGKGRANYGEAVLLELSKRLTDQFGRGFSTTNIKQMRSFYQIYSKGQAVSDLLNSQSKSGKLMRKNASA